MDDDMDIRFIFMLLFGIFRLFLLLCGTVFFFSYRRRCYRFFLLVSIELSLVFSSFILRSSEEHTASDGALGFFVCIGQKSTHCILCSGRIHLRRFHFAFLYLQMMCVAIGKAVAQSMRHCSSSGERSAPVEDGRAFSAFPLQSGTALATEACATNAG